MSHGNVSHHLQVSLDPAIDHAQFRVYSGFGQQLGPIVLFNAAGVIDGLASIYPKAVSSLFALAEKRPITEENLQRIQSMQFKVSRAEEFVVKNGIKGMKEAIYTVLSMGNKDGGRLPLKGGMPPGEWEAWKVAMDAMAELESA